jgi:hypothetical protein
MLWNRGAKENEKCRKVRHHVIQSHRPSNDMTLIRRVGLNEIVIVYVVVLH